MHPGRPYPSIESCLMGAPLLLALVELLHPQPHDLLKLDVPMWLAVHYAQIALFPLSALAITWLIRGRTGIAAAISRVALFVFGIGWRAWDSVAGVATGILVSAAHQSGMPDAWRASIDAIWLHPIMGGAPGTVLCRVGISCLVNRCSGRSSGPKACRPLVGTCHIVRHFQLWNYHLQDSRWPGGPLTYGGIAIASAWLVWEQARKRTSGTEPAPQMRASATSD
jgi:hypothetical protein